MGADAEREREMQVAGRRRKENTARSGQGEQQPAGLQVLLCTSRDHRDS